MQTCYHSRMPETTLIPGDFEGRGQLIGTLIEDNQRLSQKQSELEAEIRRLRSMIDELMHGKQSERRVPTDPAQSLLPFADESEFQEARKEAEAEAEEIIQKYTVERTVRKQKPRDESLPAHLPRIEKEMDVPDEQKHCPEHGPRQVVGYDRTESLGYKPAEQFVIVRIYPKYACPGCAQCGIVSAERPTGLVEGDKYLPSVAAAILTAKWFHYLPVYRHQDIFASSGWTPSRSTLQNIITQSAFVLEPLHENIKRLVKQDIGVGIDDTGCRLLLPKEMPAEIVGDQKNMRLRERLEKAIANNEKSISAKMWVYSGLSNAPYNIFDFRVSRHRDGPEDFFGTSNCIVQGDCFSGNESVVLSSNGRLTLAACWAHARRKLVDVTTYRDEAETLLGMIRGLYDIETRAAPMSWQDRQELRQRESTVILRSIKQWLHNIAPGVLLPKSDFSAAVGYLRNHWEALNVYVSDGRIPIDNNSVEQLMKQVALGRKAWLFVGNVEAGERSAMLMSLVSSARRHDLDVWAYLTDVLEQLLAGRTDYDGLLPDKWKLDHPEAVRQYRVEERRDKADRKQVRAARRRLAAKSK